MAKKSAPKLKTLRSKLDAAYSWMKQERSKKRDDEAGEKCSCGKAGCEQCSGSKCACGKPGCKGCAGYK